MIEKGADLCIAVHRSITTSTRTKDCIRQALTAGIPTFLIEDEQAIPGNPWLMLRPYYGTVAGMRFCSADLGLFVFQYGLDLLDLRRWRAPGEIDLPAEARLATEANLRFCRELACHFATYRRHWGLSAGDGPGNAPALDTYRCYAPSGPVDGTAHLTATLGAIAHRPDAVLENLRNAETDGATTARGRYGNVYEVASLVAYP